MPAWRLLALYAAWVVASAAIAIAAGGFCAIAADFFGMSGGGASVVFDVVTVSVFLVAAALPFLLRRRIVPPSGQGDQG